MMKCARCGKVVLGLAPARNRDAAETPPRQEARRGVYLTRGCFSQDGCPECGVKLVEDGVRQGDDDCGDWAIIYAPGTTYVSGPCR